MTVGEADRVAVIMAVVEKRLTQREAAARLGLSVRQVKRLAKRYRAQGAAGMASARRGAPSNRAFGEEVRLEALSLVRERYPDFGPKFAAEKLLERHGLALSRETLRKWMAEEGLWRPKGRRRMRVHQSRPRRARVGELVQVDGSPHDWFEGRGPRCTLIVFIDDATSRLLALRFVAAETTEAYMETLRGHLAEHGRPVALYSDRYSVFRVNRKDGGDAPTQFTRALLTLDIEPIHAGTPQAKGRVERANLTLQDRLVKELRLRGVDGMEAANAYLPEFVAEHNRRCGGAAGGGGRAPAGAPRRGRAGADPLRAPRPQAVEEPDVPVRAARAPARGEGVPVTARASTGRWRCCSAARLRSACWRRARRRFRWRTRRTSANAQGAQAARTGSAFKAWRGGVSRGGFERAPRFPPSSHRRF